jgi:hypothetical protein
MPTVTRTNSKNGVTFIIQYSGVNGTRPCRLGDALRTQSPAPSEATTNFSFGKCCGKRKTRAATHAPIARDNSATADSNGAQDERSKSGATRVIQARSHIERATAISAL